MAVLRPLKLVITNYPEDQIEELTAVNNPEDESMGTRTLPFSRELYIEQSPLFHADKVTTPLLLLHGDSDTNVPVGESDQMFTALKMLGREVEYVQIQGQDHWVLDHDQRIVWNDTILAFFARYLKERPGWWDALYPEPEDWR